MDAKIHKRDRLLLLLLLLAYILFSPPSLPPICLASLLSIRLSLVRGTRQRRSGIDLNCLCGTYLARRSCRPRQLRPISHSLWISIRFWPVSSRLGSFPLFDSGEKTRPQNTTHTAQEVKKKKKEKEKSQQHAQPFEMMGLWDLQTPEYRFSQRRSPQSRERWGGVDPGQIRRR